MSSRQGPPNHPVKDSFFYWDHPIIIGDSKFSTFKLYVKSILHASNVEIVGGHGKQGTLPEITDKYILFNGLGMYTDSFYFPKVSDDLWPILGISVYKDGMDCYQRLCNTRLEPYDEVVVACLRAAKFLDIIPTWDCNGYYDDHKEGWELFDVVNISMVGKGN